MKNKSKKGLLIVVFFIVALFIKSNVYAEEIKQVNVEKFEYDTTEINLTTEKLTNLGTWVYSKPSSVYQFVDEQNLYNVVYTSKKNVYWTKFDDKMNRIKEVSFPMLYDQSTTLEFLKDISYNFGAAIYDNGYLYVTYGRCLTNSKIESAEENVFAIVKYDQEGNIVKKTELTSFQVNNTGTDWNFGTYFLFYGSVNCTLAIKDGVITCLMGTMMMNQHHSSVTMFFDTENLNFLSDYYGENKIEKYVNVTRDLCTSHSFDQRTFIQENGDILLVERCDASHRGIVFTKLKENSEENKFTSSRFIPFHFREGTKGSHGYNSTFASIGNIIEVSDGILYFGSGERTLSAEYGNEINGEWDVYAQKIKKNFEESENIESTQMFTEEPVRTVTGEKPSDTSLGRLYLKGNEKDYGIKWLTEYKNDYAVLLIRAVKLENENIALIWTRGKIATENNGYYFDSEEDVFCQIVNKDAEAVTSPIRLYKTKMSDDINYVYKDGYIYWPTTDGKTAKITINKLDVNNMEKNATEFKLTTLKTEELEDKTEIIFLDQKKFYRDINNVEKFPILDEGYSLSFYKNVNEESVAYNEYLGSRNIISIEKNWKEKKRYIVVVKGDVTGNGCARMYDAFQILKDTIIPGVTLDVIDIKIRDYNEDGNVRMYDAFQFLKDSILG